MATCPECGGPLGGLLDHLVYDSSSKNEGKPLLLVCSYNCVQSVASRRGQKINPAPPKNVAPQTAEKGV